MLCYHAMMCVLYFLFQDKYFTKGAPMPDLVSRRLKNQDMEAKKIQLCTLINSMGFSLTHQVNKVQRWLALSHGAKNSPMKLSIEAFHSKMPWQGYEKMPMYQDA